MSRTNYRRPRARRQGGCVRGLGALVFVLALLFVVYALVLRPQFSRFVAEQITGLPVSQGSGGSAPAPQQTVEGRVASQLPTVVAALPPGQLVISESDANSYIAQRPGAIAPLDSANLRFVPGRAEADVSAYGLSSVASIGLAAQDGRLVVTGANIDGPLALAISGDDLAQALATQLNGELARQNRYVDEVRIEQGQIVLTTR